MLRSLASGIDAVNAKIGLVAAYLVYVIIAIIVFEIVMRSFFNQPTTWVHDTSGWLQVFYIFLGGAWALHRGYLVRVDVLYQNFPIRVQAFIDLFITTTLMAVFCYIMITRGFDFAMRAYDTGEVPMSGAWKGPVWPAKAVIVVGMTLLSLAWLSRAIRAGIRLFDPTAIESEDDVEAAG